MSATRLDIAGVRVDLAGGLCRERILQRYGAFAGAAGPGGWILDLVRGTAAPGDRGTWRVKRSNARVVIEGPQPLGWLDPESRRGEAVAEPTLFAVDALVRAALTLDVLSRGGCLFHASAVQVDGKAHLFPGRSGAGKSTLTTLSSAPLCEELCAVLPGPGGFQVHGTPWWNGRPACAPLAGVYELAWGGEGVALRPRSEGLRHLLANVTLVLDEPATRAAAFLAAGRVAAGVPFGRFSFTPRSNVDGLLRDARRAA